MLADDDTPYDLEARQIRKHNIRAQRRLQTYLRQLEKYHRGRVSQLDRQITETKLEARTFKFERDRSTFELFTKYQQLAIDLEKGNEREASGMLPSHIVRSKTVWQNPESVEFKSRVQEENNRIVTSEIARRVQSEPPPWSAVKYGRLDIPERRTLPNARPSTEKTKNFPQVRRKVFGHTDGRIKGDHSRPILISEGSRLTLKQRGEVRKKVLPMFTNPATAHIHALWESNTCLVRGHVPAGGIHIDIPCVTGRGINGSGGVDHGEFRTSQGQGQEFKSRGESVTFRLPKMDHPPVTQKPTRRKKCGDEPVYSVKIAS